MLLSAGESHKSIANTIVHPTTALVHNPTADIVTVASAAAKRELFIALSSCAPKWTGGCHTYQPRPWTQWGVDNCIGRAIHAMTHMYATHMPFMP